MAFFNRKELEKALDYWYNHLEVNNQEQNEAAWCAINAIRYCIEYNSDYPDEHKTCQTRKYYAESLDQDAREASIPYTYNAPEHDWKCGYPESV